MLDSPYRLTASTVAAGLLAGAGFIAGNRLSPHTPLLILVALLVLIAIGMTGLFWGAHTLREAIRNERWPEHTLAPFRRVIDHPLWKWAMGLLMVAMLVALIKDRHQRTYFWGVFCLLQTQTQITTALARPRKPHLPGAHLDWSKVAPLHSDHWGTR